MTLPFKFCIFMLNIRWMLHVPHEKEARQIWMRKQFICFVDEISMLLMPSLWYDIARQEKETSYHINAPEKLSKYLWRVLKPEARAIPTKRYLLLCSPNLDKYNCNSFFSKEHLVISFCVFRFFRLPSLKEILFILVFVRPFYDNFTTEYKRNNPNLLKDNDLPM